jgi:hypothetical protein
MINFLFVCLCGSKQPSELVLKIKRLEFICFAMLLARRQLAAKHVISGCSEMGEVVVKCLSSTGGAPQGY